MFSFNIPLPDSAPDPYSVVDLLRHTSTYLQVNYPNAYISGITLTGMYFGKLRGKDITLSKPTLEISGWKLTKKAMQENRQSLKYFGNHGQLTAPRLPLKISHDLSSKNDIGLIEQRLEKPGYPADTPLLLQQIADAIDKLGDVRVIDLVYHDYIDEDAQQHPFVRFYFAKPNTINDFFKY